MRHPKWPWLTVLLALFIALAAPAFLNAEVYSNAITIKASQSTRMPTCSKFASSCAAGGLCTEVVFAGKVKGRAVGNGKAEIDVASGPFDSTGASADDEGCAPVYLDICYSTKIAPGQEIVAQLNRCPAAEDNMEIDGQEEITGGYQLIRSSENLKGWGQVSGTAQMTRSPETLKLTLSGVVER